MRNIVIMPEAFRELTDWANDDVKILSKIIRLIDDIRRTPFEGLGKPEPLRGDFKGFWSRRITSEHRLIYRIDDERIIISACRSHYK